MERPGVPEPFADLTGRHQHQVFQHREALVLAGNLEGSAELLAEYLVWSEGGDVFTLEDDLPGVGTMKPGNGAEQCRLARSIGADQPGDGAFANIQRAAIDGLQTAEALAQIAYAEQCAIAWRRLRFIAAMGLS